jgi:hypothetical protein
MCYEIDTDLLRDDVKFVFPTNGRNNALSTQDIYYAKRAYPVPLNLFPKNSKVTFDAKKALIHFDAIRRPLFKNYESYDGREATVIQTH